MKRIAFLLFCFLAMASSAHAVECFSTPTELIKYDESKTQNGVVMFTAGRNGKGKGQNWVINNKGEVVNEILSRALDGYMQMTREGFLLVNGSVPEADEADIYQMFQAGQGNGMIELYKWGGTLKFQLEVFSVDHRQHHEVRRIWNSKLNEWTYLMLIWERLGAEDAVALGASASYSTQYENGWTADAIYEMNEKGEIVWRWAFVDHVVQNYDATKTAPFNDVCGRYVRGATYGDPKLYPGKLNINFKTIVGGPQIDWNHCNSLDYNYETGHIAINSRVFSEMYIIDHDGTFVSTTDWSKNTAAAQSDDGDFLYRFGNPITYGQATTPTGYFNAGYQQMFNGHDVQWIGNSVAYDGWEEAMGPLPGHGNMLIFDNGMTNPILNRSRIIEWNPYDADGNYVNPPDVGYNGGAIDGSPYFKTSNQVVWMYQSRLSNSFNSYYISNTQRMPNGNTFINSGVSGHFFEVTPTGEVVWEYINPIAFDGPTTKLDDSMAIRSLNATGSENQVFKAYKYPMKHPGLKDKNMYPRGTLTGETPGSSSSGDSSGGDSGSGGGGAGGGGGGY